MTFVPSRDLPLLQSRGSDKNNLKLAIHVGLERIARALGAVENEVEHLYFGDSLSETSRSPISRASDKERSLDEEEEERVEGKEEEEEEEESFLELRYIRDWLTGVSCLRWLPVLLHDPRAEVLDATESGVEDSEEVDEIVRQAARLISICAGKSASGNSRKVYHFAGLPDGEAVAVQIQEQVIVDDSLGTRTWGSAPLLATDILQRYLPDELKRCESLAARTAGSEAPRIRILELGAGTGLVGLAMAQYIRSRQGRGEVYLTDFHPDVLANLRANASLNGWDQRSTDGVTVRVSALDWRGSDTMQEVGGDFDLIVAADCVYEAEHALLVKAMAERYLSQQQSTDHPSKVLPSRLFLFSPLRPTHQAEQACIAIAFPPYSVSPSSSCLQLRITDQQDVAGYDDFGPPPLLQSIIASQRIHDTSRKTWFRRYIIQWCHT